MVPEREGKTMKLPKVLWAVTDVCGLHPPRWQRFVVRSEGSGFVAGELDGDSRTFAKKALVRFGETKREAIGKFLGSLASESCALRLREALLRSEKRELRKRISLATKLAKQVNRRSG